MKYIVAVIQQDRMHEVLDALDAKNIHLVTVTQVLGHGRQKGEAVVYRGHKEAGRLLKKVKLEIGVNDEFVEAVVQAITSAARTGVGEIGDGKLFVLNLDEVVRIRTGERGCRRLRTTHDIVNWTKANAVIVGIVIFRVPKIIKQFGYGQFIEPSFGTRIAALYVNSKAS